MTSISLPSYAKINLGLLIKYKRPDGFHEIETILKQIDLKDSIDIIVRMDSSITVKSDSESVPDGEANLCYRAAALLQKTFDLREGADIRIRKKIPVGAGLGGGSSNAAVTLLGLNRLWNLKLSAEQLEALAADIGSDVPFFIRGGTALATGRGEKLKAIHLPLDLNILIVFTGLTISTAWAYNQMKLDLTKKEKNIKLPRFNVKNRGKTFLIRSFKNDFEQPIFNHHPVLFEIKQKLYQSDALFAGLSGSGSAVFGLFKGKGEGLKARQKVGFEYFAYLGEEIEWGIKEVN